MNGDGLDQVHGDFAFDHFVGHFLVNRVPVKRADHPADADVGDHLAEVVAGDGVAAAVDGAPDEVVDRDVEEVGDDAGEIAQAEGEDIDEADAREFGVGDEGLDPAAHSDLALGRCDMALNCLAR